MRTYITQDGERFTVRTARDLVREMRSRAMFPRTSKREWMAATRQRVMQETRRRIDINSDSAFVAGLVEARLLREENASD